MNQQWEKFVKQELERRDDWEIRSAELRYLAKGKKIWVIKSPAPDTAEKEKWAEYQFYLAFKRELENLGYFVYIDYQDNWKGPIDADYVLVSLAHKKYRPDRRMKIVNIFFGLIVFQTEYLWKIMNYTIVSL